MAQPKQPPSTIVSDDVDGLEIARGRVPKTTCIRKFGHNDSIGTSFQTIWDANGIYSYLASATALSVSSPSASDSASGAGARTLRIYGLDADYLEINELVTLNASTAVSTAQSYLRVYRAVVETAGSAGINKDHIYVYTGANTGGTPNATASIRACISPSHGQTQMAVYTIPAGKTGYWVGYDSTIGGTRIGTFEIFTRPFGGAFNIKKEYDLTNDHVDSHFAVPEEIPEKTDMEFRGKVDASSARMAAGFDIILIDKEAAGPIE
jgi:hypothetical protein